ncbi:hypothetical protein Taro_041979 [Colocasia esculenta]|uniref:HMA domain-containing protein n=1 Tax=Colocasia esculenta TaxID=4460 RepID=A0A843WXC1_COLES|nr:hypothetical protein [Colocasia esculenta]
MAPLLFRGMKGVNISCASPASTATCTGMDSRRSVVGRHSTATARGIDRQVPHLRDARRARSLKNWVVPPSPSKLKSYPQKSRKSADVPGSLVSPAASSRYLLNDDDDDAFFDVFPDLDPLPVLIPVNSSRFQSAAGDESPALRPSCSSSSSFATASAAASRDQVCFKASSSSSLAPPTPLQVAKCDGSVPVRGPSASTKYGEHLRAAAAAALPSAGFRIVKGDAPPVIEPSPSRRSQSQAFFRSSSSLSETRFHTTKVEESAVLKPSSSARTRDQVVILRVSLHCKGCEAKVKKHISRMEGVTSFNIDFAAKKVTVIGDVTPLGVLSSISKVKNAQFWPSPRLSSTSS